MSIDQRRYDPNRDDQWCIDNVFHGLALDPYENPLDWPMLQEVTLLGGPAHSHVVRVDKEQDTHGCFAPAPDDPTIAVEHVYRRSTDDTFRHAGTAVSYLPPMVSVDEAPGMTLDELLGNIDQLTGDA